MTAINVIVELAATKKLEGNYMAEVAGTEPGLDLAAAPKLAALEMDASYAPLPLPAIHESEPEAQGAIYDPLETTAVDLSLGASTYLVRGAVDEDDLARLRTEAEKSRAVVGVYADVSIEPMLVCPGSPALGTDADVERLLCTRRLHRCHMDGTGVLVAIVDTGFNIAYLNGKGKTPTFDSARSWAANPAGISPGAAPVNHGTMCAYDVCIAAPHCTLLDVPLLRPLTAPPGGSLMSGLLSDAVKAYSHLLGVMTAPRRPGENRSLVVSNSWGMFQPSWDFPVGDPGNYSDNPSHPFNKIVVTLAKAGADILFAAGNCGVDCPDGRCGNPPFTTKAIYGANSSRAVTCVAGVDTTKTRAGYSAIGPGRLSKRKPDISGYTHFLGSGVYPADGGTSAATPVVAGVVAAVRSARPYDPADPASRPTAIRSLLTSTAEDLGTTGYDFKHGYGVVDGCALATKLGCHYPPIIDLCKHYPWLCGPRIDICKRYPWICRGFPKWPPIPPRPGDPFLSLLEEAAEADDLSEQEIAFLVGFARGVEAEPETMPGASPQPRTGGCGCGGEAD